MFSENYSVCLNDDGSPRQIGSNGPAVTYKAIGYESGRAVAMQLIPLTSLSEGERVRFEESVQAAHKLNHDNIAKIFELAVDDDHFIFVSEYGEGESADEWIDEHGPMPPDAVLRIGFQLTNALAAGEENGVLSHSIQPANVMILPGVAADGGWPGIKIRNFGLPAVRLNTDGDDTCELVPSLPPQFASPEQRANTTLDVRSDVFSLGATMWFLLTGSAPPLCEPHQVVPRLSAPDVPRFVRNLVSWTLRTNPAERPDNLVSLAEKLRTALQKAERRTAFTRSFAPTAIPGTMKAEKRRPALALALAAAVLVFAALGAFVLPQRFADRERKPLGVLVGVPETTPETAVTSGSAMAPAGVPEQNEPSPAIAQQSESPATPAQNSPASVNSGSTGTDELATSPQLALNNRTTEAVAPAEGPGQTNEPGVVAEAPPLAEKSEPVQPAVPENNQPPPSDVPDTATTGGSSSAVSEKAKPVGSEQIKKRDDLRPSKRKLRRQRLARSSAPRSLAPLRVGSASARVVGTTANGNWVLRLPSGERIIAPPVPDLEDAPVVTPRYIHRVERPFSGDNEPPVMVLPPD